MNAIYSAYTPLTSERIISAKHLSCQYAESKIFAQHTNRRNPVSGTGQGYLSVLLSLSAKAATENMFVS